MGSAMALVARGCGHEVKLWGTWLDDDLLAPCERGEAHPRLKLPLSGPTPPKAGLSGPTPPKAGLPDLALYRAPRLAEALRDAEIIIFGVNSDGAIEVTKRATAAAREIITRVPILSVTKGLLVNAAGKMDRIDAVLSEVVGHPLRFVHAAGPAKAMEIARGVLTWMAFAGAPEDAEPCRAALAGKHMHITTTTDRTGAELCSALKNAYATGLGLWDGLIGIDAHDARAACFTQSILEMRRLVTAGGGLADTVYGPAGIGDLHVTGAGGRNRAFGERVGRGRPAGEVAREMLAAGELTEGYPAIATASRFARERGVTPLPLLDALHAIIWQDAPVRETLAGLRLDSAPPVPSST